jgi:hypothetical protein
VRELVIADLSERQWYNFMRVTYEIRQRGRRGRERYELWRVFDFGDGSPLRLEHLDTFDDYMQASELRRLEIEEEKRTKSAKS